MSRNPVHGLALDIDETLAGTNAHWLEHMMRFHAVEMSPDQLRAWHDLGTSVPEWETPAAKAHMQRILESNEFQETIPLLHESNAMVRRLHELVPIVAYISARPEAVRAGTTAWLKRHGFPEADIILRPGRPGLKELESKNAWKAGVLKGLYPRVLGIVDDNPGLPDELAKVGYQGTLFVYGPQMRKLEPSAYPFPVVVSPTWDHVLDHFSA